MTETLGRRKVRPNDGRHGEATDLLKTKMCENEKLDFSIFKLYFGPDAFASVKASASVSK